MSPLFVALPPADLPAATLQPPALHTVELLAATKTSGRHTVRSGDTVYDIATRYGVTPQAIVRANGLKEGGRWIMPGEVLTIPGKGGGSTPAAPSKAGTSSGTSASPRTSSSSGTITVRAGDTLSDLSVRHSTTVAALARANNISASGFIYPGQRLVIPGSKASAPSRSASPKATASTSTKAHGGTVTVRAGDTLSGIAQRHGTTVRTLAATNGINAGSFIYPGQRLRLPGAASTGSSSAKTTANRPLDRPYDETNIGSYKADEDVPDTFLHYRYSSGVARSAAANREHLASVDVPSRAQMKKIIVAAAGKHGVDSKLMLALSYQESGWNHRAVSPANAIGAMQVIPSSGTWASSLVGRELNLLDPHDNAEAGVVIIKALLASGASRDHAIGGYYQGLASVRQHGMFPDTERYVRNIKHIMTTL